MAGGLVPHAIVLAFGAATLGGADALRLLRQLAGRSPAVDLALCFVVISLLTAPLLGTMLLARFVRKARAGGSAPATELFAQVTATVSVGAALLVTACLIFVPGVAVRLPIDFVVKNPVVVTVLAICAAVAATASLPFAVHLRARFLFRGAGSAGGPTPAAPAKTIKIVAFLLAMSSLVASFVAHAQLLFPEFHWRKSIDRMVTVPVGVATAIVAVAGTMLLVRCSRRVRSAAGAGGGAAAARTN